MRLSGRKSGSTLFIDSSCDEVLLQVLVDEAGTPRFAFKLYDSTGKLVMDSPEPRSFPEGLCVKSLDDELLLEIPTDLDRALVYRLYGQTGRLLTYSDGQRTEIFPFLHMGGGNRPSGR
jgi:hypothetical protein